MFGYVSLEARLPRNHPLRSVRTMVDDALCKVSRRFATLYAESGRPSIPPERLVGECSGHAYNVGAAVGVSEVHSIVEVRCIARDIVFIFNQQRIRRPCSCADYFAVTTIGANWPLRGREEHVVGRRFTRVFHLLVGLPVATLY